MKPPPASETAVATRSARQLETTTIRSGHAYADELVTAVRDLDGFGA
jgi:hypothetical protein